MQIRAYLYDAEGADGEVAMTDDLIGNLTNHQLLWVDIQDMARPDLLRLSKMFEWNPDSIYSLMQTGRRPRIDQFGTYFQANVDTIQEADKMYQVVALHFVVGKNYVVTAHQETVDLLQSFANRIRDDSDLGHLDSAELFASLLDWHITDYFRVVDRLEMDVDRMDEQALRQRSEDKLLNEMVTMRRRIARVRRVLTPHREVFSALTRPEFRMLTSESAPPHFRALHDRLERAIDAIENARELLIGSFDIYMAQTTRRTNEVVKTLTLFSVPFFVGSVLTGLMGMNFKIPLYDTGAWGFFGVLSVIGLISSLTLLIAHKKRWL